MKYYNREWYLFGCKETAETRKYIQYMQENLPRWYNDFSFHDSKILSVEKQKSLMILNMQFDDCKHTKYQLKLHSPNIIECCKLENTWWLCDEIYKTKNSYEFHIMVDWSDDNGEGWGYFTAECSDIELIFANRTYGIKDSDDKTIVYN